MNRQKAFRLRGLFLPAALAGLVPGLVFAQMVHVHSNDSEQSAREALSALDKLPGSSVFQEMLRNLDAAHQLSMAVLWERGQARMTGRVDEIADWDWNTLTKRLEGSQAEFVAAYRKALAERQESSLGLDALASSLQIMNAQIRAAKELIARHQTGEKEASEIIEHYESAVGEIQKIAADPDLAKKLKNLQLDKTQGYLKKLKDLASQADSGTGLRQLYVDLGLSLVTLEISELQMEREYHRWLFARADQRVRRLRKLVGCQDAERFSLQASLPDGHPEAANPCSEEGQLPIILNAAKLNEARRGRNAFGAKGNEPVVATIEDLAKSGHQEEGVLLATQEAGSFAQRFPRTAALRELLEGLATYASMVSYQQFLLEVDENEEGYHARRESILLTQIEDRKLDFLLAHALQGLVAYQGGGVRPMDILNLVGGLRP